MKAIAAVIACTCIGFTLAANAKGGGGGRPTYSGSTHTSSHGGSYAGGSGSSHKGGTYRNSSSNDQYGVHSGASSGGSQAGGAGK